MKRTRILLADNDAESLASYGGLLESEGYEVVRCPSVDEARRKLEQQKLDLAVLDLRLVDDKDPDDMSGLDLADRIGGAIPIIILSSKPSSEALLRLESLRIEEADSAVYFVPKGKMADRLLQAIQRALIPRIFVVHGHDDEARLRMVDFLKTVKLQPVVLRDQPGGGRTIIEKFEEYSNVCFAVVLLTPDDVGKIRARGNKLKPRARQNVILELGFFLGALGRSRVAIVSKQAKEQIEIPSDYAGIQYITMDPGDNWRIDLARELMEAKIQVDLKKIVQGS